MRIDGRTPEQARPVSIQTDFVRTADGSCLIATGNTRVICTASVEEGVPPFLRGKGQGWVTAEYAMLPASTGTRKKRDGVKKDGRSVEIQRLIGRSIRQAVDMNLVMNEKGEFIELQGTGEGRSYTAEELTTLIAYGKAGIEGLQRAQREALGERARHIAPKPPLVVASGNEHKLKELQAIFGDYYTVVSMQAAGFHGMIDENADTFAGNAAIKAEAVCAATGLPTLADDSGLTVDILDGEPGVLSARYAGNHGDDAANNALLLRRMKGKEVRTAAFVCAIALKIPGRDTLIAEGACPGVILEEERGSGGFGYDPLFLYEPLGKTFAELTEEEKNQVSHRARACEKMLAIMRELHE